MRTKDVEAPWAKDVVAAYRSPAFRQWAEAKYKGYKMPEAWR
jgi:D-methionine transport system substrate-binding protein